jgi:hypothetical protein
VALAGALAHVRDAELAHRVSFASRSLIASARVRQRSNIWIAQSTLP